jgi:hypothetical protein
VTSDITKTVRGAEEEWPRTHRSGRRGSAETRRSNYPGRAVNSLETKKKLFQGESGQPCQMYLVSQARIVLGNSKGRTCGQGLRYRLGVDS